MAEAGRGPVDRTYVLALSLASTGALWALGYLCRIPPVVVPSSALFFVLIACQLAGGIAAGRWTDEGARGGAWVGGTSGLTNLLLLGGILSGQGAARLVPAAGIWIPGSLLASVMVGALGGWFGGRVRDGRPLARVEWTPIFAVVASAATFFLLIVGGVVTSQKAGLAVVDWPNSFGYSMFLYPLERMTGGIFYEHSHRLFGSFVGLATLVLTIHLWKVESRRWMKRLAGVALVAVIAQGALGGLRVTGRLTMSANPADTAPSLMLAVVHGVFAQLFFGLLVAVAAFTTTSWRNARPLAARAEAVSDRRLATWLLPLLIVQLGIGAVLRHLSSALVLHVTMAALVLVVGIWTAVRVWVTHGSEPILRRLSLLLGGGLVLQLVLGVSSFLATGLAEGAPNPPAYEVLTTTAHQATGALLLALALLTNLWLRRFEAAT